MPCRRSVVRLCFLLLCCLVLAAPRVTLSSWAQESERKGGIVVNPTVEECKQGWTEADQPKWSKQRFDQLCRVVFAPSELVANPTAEECKRGWTEADQPKWSKQRFDQLCRVVLTPSGLVVNPTAEECARGWSTGMRWSQQEFDTLCAMLRRSK